MIIVEGPDGAGKTNLVEYLASQFDLVRHERASHGVDGPVANLFDWAYNDVCSMPDQPLAVYDRHPLISEYIYGPICRSTLPPGFVTTTAHLMIRTMAQSVLVVLCRPPTGRLVASVAPERDMPGVTEHIERIASAYDAMRMLWPGQVITYDFTQPDARAGIMGACRLHVAKERSKRIHPSSGRYAR